jgi:prolipoprotein diacylglyceryl transferase
VWYLGNVPIRAYAIFIVIGIVIACAVTEVRMRARGAPKWAVLDIAVWAVPFGIVGARLYHVITSPQRFFGEDGDPARIFYIWEGGLGIWGSVAGGAVGVWLACRQLKLPFLMVADAAAVGLPLAQAVGRLGNWFNNELYGSETTLPWGLRVYQMVDGRAVVGPDGEPIPYEGLYHPTFLYEALWNVGVAILVWQLGKRLKLGRGRAFALYVMAYTAGRFWIEMLRIDDTAREPRPGAEDLVLTILGQRVNVWVSAALFVAALVYFVRVRGPQEFVVPTEDGSGYRVVTEQEYAEHQAAAAGRTGADRGEPDDGTPGEPSAGADAAAPDGSAGSGGAEPDATTVLTDTAEPAQERAAEDPPDAGPDRTGS